MQNQGRILAPKPIRKQSNLICANNSPKLSSAKLSYTKNITKGDFMPRHFSQLAYVKTSTTLEDTYSKVSNFESEIEHEVFRNEIFSILYQQEDKLPFDLCDDFYREQQETVERVSNPFFKNLAEDDRENEEEEGDDCNDRENQRIKLIDLNLSEGKDKEDEL